MRKVAEFMKGLKDIKTDNVLIVKRGGGGEGVWPGGKKKKEGGKNPFFGKKENIFLKQPFFF